MSVKKETVAPAALVEVAELFAKKFKAQPDKTFAAGERAGLVFVVAPSRHADWLREGVRQRGGVVQKMRKRLSRAANAAPPGGSSDG